MDALNTNREEQENRISSSSKIATQLQVQVAELKEAVNSESQLKLATQVQLREQLSKVEQLQEQLEAEEDQRKVLEKNLAQLQAQASVFKSFKCLFAAHTRARA